MAATNSTVGGTEVGQFGWFFCLQIPGITLPKILPVTCWKQQWGGAEGVFF